MIKLLILNDTKCCEELEEGSRGVPESRVCYRVKEGLVTLHRDTVLLGQLPQLLPQEFLMAF